MKYQRYFDIADGGIRLLEDFFEIITTDENQ